MTFQLQYKQPFTISQAFQLDANVIFQEIARLENSLSHLRDTQEELRKYLSDVQDPDVKALEDAYKENEDVIGSQQERISMLQFVLREKGIIGYETKKSLHTLRNNSSLRDVPVAANSTDTVSTTATPSLSGSQSNENSTDEGIFL